MELLIRKPGSGRPTHDEGDVFAIYPDGSLPEAPAPGSVFWLIRVPLADPADWEHLLMPKTELVGVGVRGPVAHTTHRRRASLQWSRLPRVVREELAEHRVVSLGTLDPAWFGEKP